jgi:hypothetical protein
VTRTHKEEDLLVSHNVELETVAVIGGKRKRNFSVKQSAHAFRIMSDALYSDKPRAVVRETISNAIDAHVRAGKLDVPIEITLREGEFIVKDFGTGIHDDAIADVFCSMFGSDKTDDDTQIGGFGAGAKAPFAVSDHFTVISRHQGKRTIYSMHKEGEEDGLPVCQEMTSGACGDDSGLTVSVPISNEANYIKLINDFVFEGGINATLNGNKLPTRDLTEFRKTGYAYIPYFNETWRTPEARVLLGNVTYILETHTYPELHKYASRIFQSAGINGTLLLHANPGEVAPTPSREGLSMTDITIANLAKLLKRASNEVRSYQSEHFNSRLVELTKEIGRDKIFKTRFGITSYIKNLKSYTGRFPDAFYVGREHLGEFAVNNQLLNVNYSQIMRILPRVFHAHAKKFRNFTSKRVNSSRTYYNRSMEKIENIERVKVLHRIIGAQISNIYTESEYHRDLINIRESSRDRDWRNTVVDKVIIIARTKRDMSYFTKSNGKTESGAFMLINQRLSVDTLDDIKAKAAKFGWKVVEAPSTAPTPKKSVKKKRPKGEVYKFTAFDVDTYGGNLVERENGQYAARLPDEPTVEKPDAYVPFGVYKPTERFAPGKVKGWQGVKGSHAFFRNKYLPDRLVTLIPNIVIPTCIEDERKLEEMKTPRVGDILLEAVNEALKKHRDVALFTYVMAQGDGRHTSDRKLVCLLYDEPYSNNAEHDEIWTLIHLAKDYLNSDGNISDKNEKNIMMDLRQDFNALFGTEIDNCSYKERARLLKNIMSGKSNYNTTTTFERLNNLLSVASRSEAMNTESYEDLVAVLDFVRDRFAQK